MGVECLLPYNRKLKQRSRDLRKNATTQENKLWYEFLRKHQISFTRQKPIAQYIVDFYCHSKMLVIEVDGKQHDTVDGREYDSERTKLLESLGVYVLRFANEEVDKSFAQVCKTIQNALDTRETLFHPRPLL